MGKKWLTKEESEELKHLYFNEKQSMEMLAKHFDRDVSSIWARIKRFSKPRNRSEAAIIAHSLQRGRDNKRKNNGMWKGGKHKTPYGYYIIWLSIDDPYFNMTTKASRTNSSGYVFEHRLVMAKHIGRPLDKTEKVHHLNGIKDDNRIKNLAIVPHHSPHLFPQLLQKRIRDLETELSQQHF